MSPEIIQLLAAVLAGIALKLLEARRKTSKKNNAPLEEVLTRELQDCQERVEELERVNEILQAKKQGP